MKHSDKLKHLAVFTVAHYALLVVFAKVLSLQPFAVVLASSSIIAVAAFMTEDAQRTQEGRVKDGWDAFADMVSIPTGIALFLLTQHWIPL